MSIEAAEAAVKGSMQSSRGDAGTRMLNPGVKAWVRREAHRRCVRRGMEAPMREEVAIW